MGSKNNIYSTANLRYSKYTNWTLVSDSIVNEKLFFVVYFCTATVI